MAKKRRLKKRISGLKQFIKSRSEAKTPKLLEGMIFTYLPKARDYVLTGGYDPVTSLGIIRPSKIKEVLSLLKKKLKYFHQSDFDKGKGVSIFMCVLFFFLMIGVYIYLLIYLSKINFLWTLLFAFLGLPIMLALPVYYGKGIGRRYARLVNERIDKRREKMNDILQKFVGTEDSLLSELPWLKVEVGKYGSWFKFDFGFELLDRIKFNKIGSRPARDKTPKKPKVIVPKGGKPTKKQMKDINGGANLDYPSADPIPVPQRFGKNGYRPSDEKDPMKRAKAK